MRETGSRSSLRAINASSRAAAALPRSPCARAIVASCVRPAAWQSRSRASSSGMSMPACRNKPAVFAKALAKVRPLASRMGLLLHRSELVRLIVGDERIDDLVERGRAFQHIRKLVRGEGDPVVGDAPLREV